MLTVPRGNTVQSYKPSAMQKPDQYTLELDRSRIKNYLKCSFIPERNFELLRLVAIIVNKKVMIIKKKKEQKKNSEMKRVIRHSVDLSGVRS